MTNVNDIAQELLDLKNDHKDFKKANKEIFVEHRNFNKNIKSKSDALIQALREEQKEYYEYGGMEFVVKVNKRDKHNMEMIADLVGDPEKLAEYKEAVEVTSAKVATRKAKKPRI